MRRSASMPLLTAALALAVPVHGGASAGAASPEELLRRSDIGAFAPASFRAWLRLRRQPSGATQQIEVWRSGDTRTLVRFLAPKERGKYLLRLDRNLWLLAPGAKAPVRMSPSYRLYGGATLDEVLGTRHANEYVVEAAAEEESAGGALVVLELRARSERVLFPQVRYVVRKTTERPVRAEYRLRSGKAVVAVEFLEWNEKGPAYARRVVVHDLLRKGALTEVDVLEMEERPVPDALFDLRDASARRALPAKEPARP